MTARHHGRCLELLGGNRSFVRLTHEQERDFFAEVLSRKERAESLRQKRMRAGPSERSKANLEYLVALQRYHEVNLRTRQEFATYNLNLAFRIILSSPNAHSLDAEDFASAVFKGHWNAARNFDPTLGYKFSTFQKKSVDLALKRFYTDKVRSAKRKVLSLDSDNEGMHDQVGDDQVGDDQEVQSGHSITVLETQDRVRHMLDTFPFSHSKARDVLYRRFGIEPYKAPQTLEQVGEEYGLCKERVRQIHQHALDELRSSETFKLLTG